MKQFTVDAEFILAAHKVACAEWKQKIENKFPDLFLITHEKHEVIYNEWVDGTLEKTKTYLFAIGDKVKVNDGSYNIDTNGIHRSGISELFQNNTAKVIAVNTGNTYSYNTLKERKVTLNLLLEFPEGELVYCAPNCVETIK